MFRKAQAYAKFIAAMLTVIATAGAGMIPSPYNDVVQLVIAVLGAFAVYAVPNVPASVDVDGRHEAP